MTKTLTEKWRNEELPINLYYVIDKLGRETIGNDCGIRDMMVDAFNGGNIFIKEVLEPVPSYDHFSQLVKKVEQLQERLADADKALKYMDEKYGEHYTIADGTKMGNSPAWKYMLKWGVK